MELKLPDILATKQDVVRIHRDLQAFMDTAAQSILRHEKPVKYPGISDSLRAVAVANQINLHNEEAAQRLLDDLGQLKEKMIVIHISFTTDPPVEVLHKIVAWLRQEINPQIVIQVGLQPSIAAGIILRTPKHQYDFSLRQHLYKQRDKLIEAIK